MERGDTCDNCRTCHTTQIEVRINICAYLVTPGTPEKPLECHPRPSQSSTLLENCTASNKIRDETQKKIQKIRDVRKINARDGKKKKKNSEKHKQAGGTKLPVFATSCWLAAKRKQS